mmetsp:Transcript_46646/g.56469  ORF Transcript_46646/g.56469 Transcript_46646/m.56469 type:complete len:479 (+) Transcript_46646:113-1549(+)
MHNKNCEMSSSNSNSNNNNVKSIPSKPMSISRSLTKDTSMSTNTQAPPYKSITMQTSIPSPSFPTKKLSRPSMMSRVGSKTVAPAPMTPSSPKKRDICSSTLLLKNNDCSSQLPSFCMWNVKDDVSLPVLPLYYPLQKNNIVISDASLNPSQVACRISECLRSLSVAANYDGDKFMARVETADHTKFDIRLFAPKESSKDIIVEMQRYSGSSISFHHCYCSIARAITQSGKSEDNLPRPSKRMRNLTQPLASINNNPMDGLDAERVERINAALETAANLLNKDRIDANLLGMESLRLQTDTSRTSLESAICVATAFFGHSPNARYSTLYHKITCLIKHSRLNENESTEDAGDSFDVAHYNKMTNHALAVLANSLSLLACLNSSIISSLHLHYNTWRCCDDELIMRLMKIMKECDSKPHDAYLAARCLNMLLKLNDEHFKEMILEWGLLETIKYCHVVGQCSILSLEKESEGLLFALEN